MYLNYFNIESDDLLLSKEAGPFYSIFVALIILAANAVISDRSPVLGYRYSSRLLRAVPYICFVDAISKVSRLFSASEKYDLIETSEKALPYHDSKQELRDGLSPLDQEEPPSSRWTQAGRVSLRILAITQLIKLYFYQGTSVTHVAAAAYAIHYLASMVLPIAPACIEDHHYGKGRINMILAHASLLLLLIAFSITPQTGPLGFLKMVGSGAFAMIVTIIGERSRANDLAPMQVVALSSAWSLLAIPWVSVGDCGILATMRDNEKAHCLVLLMSFQLALYNGHLLGGRTSRIAAVTHCLVMAGTLLYGGMAGPGFEDTSERPLWTGWLV